MSQPYVINVNDYRKQVFYDGQPSPLLLDFKPFIEAFTLEEECCLIHWQARPKYKRRWGVYDSKTKRYECFLRLAIEGSVEAVQLDEAAVVTIPTAVLIARNPRIEKFDDFAIITGG